MILSKLIASYYCRLIVFSFLFLPGSLLGQDEHQCGTHATPEQIKFMSSIREDLVNTRATRNFAEVNIPVKFFIIRRSNGTGGMSIGRPEPLLSEVNAIYSNVGMSFFQVEPPTFIDSDAFFSLDQSEEGQLANARDLSNVINIYVSGPVLTSGSTPLCGYTRFPPSTDRIFLNVNCADDEVSTTAHELGHYFTLFHTHGKTNQGTTDELVARENCDILGDDICDTPADPNLSGLVTGSCQYVGTAVDSRGAAFAPNPRNIMAFAPRQCRDFLSPGQFQRIRNGFENGRTNLNVIFTNFRARINSDIRVGCAPVSVQFFDETQNATRREWEFEGGNISTSSQISPTVRFDEPGTYSVTLRAFNAAGTESEVTRTAFITVLDPFRNLLQEESFTTFEGQSIPDNWDILNEDQLLTFTTSEVSVDEFGGSILLSNFDYGAEVVPQIDDLELSSLDLGEISVINLSFDFSYTFRPGDILNAVDPGFDSLEVGYRLDCDNEFISVFREGGEELSTVPGTNDFFIPTQASEWRAFNMEVRKDEIPSFEDFRVFRPTIRNISRNGNNLYIDNIRIFPDFSIDSIEFFRAGNASFQSVELRWSNPANNESAVVVERSVDGVNFSEIVVLDRDASEYVDNDIPEENNILFYRVFNTNSRTRSSFSEVLEVPLVVTSTGDLPISEEQLTIFPNPSSNGNFSLRCGCNFKKEYSSMKIYDLTGSEVLKLSSENVILGNTGEVTLDLNLEGGIYLLRLSESVGQGVKTLRLLVN